MEPDTLAKGKSLLAKDVKKMLVEQKLNHDPLVVSKLTSVAQSMAIDMLKDAQYYSVNKDGIINREDMQIAIRMQRDNEPKRPDDDTLIGAAVDVNGNPLSCKENLGVALPKDHLGNCNYRLRNPEKRAKMYEGNLCPSVSNGSYLEFLKTCRPGGMFIFKRPVQCPRNEVPIKITVTPKFNAEGSVLKKQQQ